MTTHRTTILADADLLERVGRYASRHRTTRTAVITAAIEAFLEANDEAPDLPSSRSGGASTVACRSTDARSPDAGRSTPARLGLTDPRGDPARRQCRAGGADQSRPQPRRRDRLVPARRRTLLLGDLTAELDVLLQRSWASTRRWP
jgi:hypothetical protein